MVSMNRQEGYGRVYNDVRCLSTDQKPTEHVKNGSALVEIDTGKGYLFDAASSARREVPQGSSVVINPASGVSF